MKRSEKLKNLIRQFIVWYIFKYEHGKFTVRRKSGAEQTCRIFSKQAHDNIVIPAFEFGGIFYSQAQLNNAIEEAVKAAWDCGEDSDCAGCYLRIKEDDCVMNHIWEEQGKEAKCGKRK